MTYYERTFYRNLRATKKYINLYDVHGNVLKTLVDFTDAVVRSDGSLVVNWNFRRANGRDVYYEKGIDFDYFGIH